MAENRHSELLALLLARGQTPVQGIAEALGASVATVRRDLTELERLGRVERLHGAARIAAAARTEVAFATREQENSSAKRAIAETAAKLLLPGAAVFLDAGTTVLQLARHIATFDQRIRVFTNGLNVALELAPHSHVDLTLIGGRIRHENMSMVGPLTCKMLDLLWVDQLFLGATAIDQDGYLTSVDSDEAEANERMIRRAEQTIVLADHSKFQRRMTHTVARLGAGHTLVSDVAPEGALADYGQAVGLNFERTAGDVTGRAADGA